jgi:hypothetical protein
MLVSTIRHQPDNAEGMLAICWDSYSKRAAVGTGASWCLPHGSGGHSSYGVDPRAAVAPLADRLRAAIAMSGTLLGYE